ncbi:MAG: 8-oxoguanine deaminase [Pseudomonadota bacterium]
MTRLWIRSPAAVWTGCEADASGGLVIEGRHIVECVAAGQAPAEPVDNVFDATDLVILPGLINCHHHFYQTLTRALPAALNQPLFPWLKALYPVWAGLDTEAIALSTELALAELILSGCTFASDHHYVFTPHLTDAIDVQVEVAMRLGARVALTRGSMSLGERDGGLPPDSVVQDPEIILRESARLIEQWHDPDSAAMVQIALAPCSPFSVTAELMRESARLARSTGVRLHTHLAETEDENTFCLETYGQRPLDYLESLDWLASDVWLAHGIHFTTDEIDRLGAAGVAISHCPSSNMVLASGVCPAPALEQAGCSIGLGVDGSASNDGSNMIGEVRQAFLLQRLHAGAERVSHEDALRWATAGGARVLGRTSLGTLKPGQLADLGCYSLDELRFSGAGDPVAALVLCGAHQVQHLMVNGKWRVIDGEIPDVDLGALRARHDAAAKRLVAAQ